MQLKTVTSLCRSGAYYSCNAALYISVQHCCSSYPESHELQAAEQPWSADVAACAGVLTWLLLQQKQKLGLCWCFDMASAADAILDGPESTLRRAQTERRSMEMNCTPSALAASFRFCTSSFLMCNHGRKRLLEI